jgi:hypothetical protein
MPENKEKNIETANSADKIFLNPALVFFIEEPP